MAEDMKQPDPDTEGDGADDVDQQKRTVPLEALQAETDKRQERDKRIAHLEGQLSAQAEAAKATPKAEPKKEFSRIELDSAVLDGKITESDRDRILDEQRDVRTQETAQRIAKAEVETQTREKTVSEDIAAYTKLVPDVLVAGSEALTKVAKEFKWQVEQGQPSTKATELQALRSVYGPLDRLRKADEITGGRETIQEGGSNSQEPDDNSGDRKDGSPKDLSSREKSYYEDQIRKGLFKDWDHVKTTMKFADQGVRRRAQARV